jgi:hypothetical protein
VITKNKKTTIKKNKIGLITKGAKMHKQELHFISGKTLEINNVSARYDEYGIMYFGKEQIFFVPYHAIEYIVGAI